MTHLKIWDNEKKELNPAEFNSHIATNNFFLIMNFCFTFSTKANWFVSSSK